MIGFPIIKAAVSHKVVAKRKYSAAGTGRLLSSWTTGNSSADSDIRQDLATLRARSRELSQNNDYAVRYLKMCVANIVGPTGIKLQMKVKNQNGRFDSGANNKIEQAFKKWSRNEYCTIDGTQSWLDVQRIAVETVARDGEILIRKIKGGNPFMFTLQIIEADHLDINMNDAARNIKMGIEYDNIGKPIAYHVLTKHPGDTFNYTWRSSETVRVSADDIIHLYYKERPSQSRGIPWMHSAMTRLNHLGAYEEAEIIAARVSAAKMGFIINSDGDQYKGDEDEDGNIQIEAEPGTFEQLPAGYDFREWNPTHPSGNFEPFMKTTLRGIASGLNVSYANLANDLEGVSYSSMRSGSLEERDQWKVKQTWIIDQLCRPIFEEWLFYALLTREVNLPFDRIDKYNQPAFYGRSWKWVDPLKDSKAAIEEINNGINTMTEVLAEQGKDFEDMVSIRKQENEIMEAAGVTLAGTVQGVSNEQPIEE